MQGLLQVSEIAQGIDVCGVIRNPTRLNFEGRFLPKTSKFMAYPKKIDENKLVDFMQDYAKKYNQFTPNPAFIAEWFDVSLQCIHNHLKSLVKKGKIRRLKKNKNYVAYIVL